MKQSLEFLKSALVTGLLIVLPAWLAVLLLIQLLVKLGVLVKPLAAQMPPGVNHPQGIAAVFLIGIHADGNSTVFMPSVPTPMAGASELLAGLPETSKLEASRL